MGILLSFTMLELIPSAIEFSHEGLIFVVLGILIPILFHHGHQHNEDLDSSASLKLLFIGAAIHSFFDGSIITTGLLVEDHMATVIISSMLLHKVTEVIMLSFLLGTMLKKPFRLLKYLVSLSFFSILGMLVAAFFFEQTEGFGAVSGVAVSLTAGIFLYISLTNISKVVECSKRMHTNLYPFIGCVIYFSLHFFQH